MNGHGMRAAEGGEEVLNRSIWYTDTSVRMRPAR